MGSLRIVPVVADRETEPLGDADARRERSTTEIINERIHMVVMALVAISMAITGLWKAIARAAKDGGAR